VLRKKRNRKKRELPSSGSPSNVRLLSTKLGEFEWDDVRG